MGRAVVPYHLLRQQRQHRFYQVLRQLRVVCTDNQYLDTRIVDAVHDSQPDNRMALAAALGSAIAGEFGLAVEEVYLLRVQLAQIQHYVLRAF